ncbi:23119_t:CDS:2 [Dentiscutata erythropus]|uniref:23119_t:CDS:1 n=1 Tax=Dentiscutata erythropus TaxID=1348616 RepID=A0A9N9H784_9GLOM|nr:23119_t:CDS:2 [Dentiscutata erythropus]
MFINTLVEGKISVKVLIDTTSKYNIISKHLFDKLESDHGLEGIVGDNLIDFQIHKNPSFDLVLEQDWLWMREAKISFGHSPKTHVCHAKIVIDSMSISLFDEDFNKASFTKNNLSKSMESKPDTSDSDSSNSSTSSSEIEVTYTHKTRAVKKRPIRKCKVKDKVNYRA